MQDLIDKVRNRDHGQRKCRQKRMAPGRKQARKSVPCKQHSDACQRDGAEYYWDGPLIPVKTHRHNPLLATIQTSTTSLSASGRTGWLSYVVSHPSREVDETQVLRLASLPQDDSKDGAHRFCRPKCIAFDLFDQMVTIKCFRIHKGVAAGCSLAPNHPALRISFLRNQEMEPKGGSTFSQVFVTRPDKQGKGKTMKYAGLLVLPAGFFLSIAAVVLFAAPGPRAGFVLCGLAVEGLGLVVAVRGHMEARGEDN
jgi:hypothetical protein